MSRSKFSLLLLLVLIIIPTIPSAQTLSDTVIVDLQLFIPDAGILFLNDLNLINLNNAPLLFAVTIENYFHEIKELILHFGIRRGNEILIDGMSDPFNIDPYPIGKIYLTSQNILSEGEKYAIQNVEIGSAAEELKNTIFSQGKLPTGLYQFFVEIDYKKYGVTQRIVIDEEEININAPTTLDLISPGLPAENDHLTEVYSTLPFFLWHSNASQFRITVCEKLPTNTSPSDVMNNEPRMQQIVPHGTYFQYPSAGVWPLEEGKTYYWQIVAIIESSSGPVELESEIWGFKIGNLSSGMFSLQHQQLLALLTLFFRDGKSEDLFEKGGALEGFTFTGMMLNNDQQITQEDLIALVEKILSNQIVIDTYFVE